MFSLYFIRSNGEKELVKSQLETDKEVLTHIKNFIHSKNPNFQIYYYRTWGTNPVVYDVGSHTEFFHLYQE